MDEPSSVSLRPISPADADFLFRVYAATREAELALVEWDDTQKAAFVRMQFDAQHRYYTANYPDASFQIILVSDRPVGRLYLVRWPEEIRIIDVSVLPEFRGCGVGTRVLGELLAEARTTGVCVTIHVERNNPALDWYERLGFVLAEDKGVYLYLRATPA